MENKFTVKNKYLNLRVTEHGKKSEITLIADGEVVHRFRARLAEGLHEYSVHVELDRFIGKTLEVKVEGYRGEDAFSKMSLSDKPEGHESIYREDLRPKYHFSAICGWLNDPNGLMYYNGKYFAFAQLNPYFRWCDNMHWLSLESTDLIHWEDKGLLLHADHNGQKFSGSGVVDYDNATGLGCGEHPPLLLFYTDFNYPTQSDPNVRCHQNLAYSTDGGASWQEYEHNPVLPEVDPWNRDPKVIKSPDGNGYLMALYSKGCRYSIYHSLDMLSWSKKCDLDIEGCEECPDIYEMFLDGDKSQSKMIFSCAGGQYLVGKIEGGEFISESKIQRTYCGGDVYAPQTFFGAPNGRRIQIICTSNSSMIPGTKSGKFLTVPCDLTLKSTSDGIKLFSTPVSELRDIEDKITFSADTLTISDPFVPSELCDGLYRAEFALDASYEGEINIGVFDLILKYNGKDRYIEHNGEKFYIHPEGATVSFDLLVDRCSAELFVNDGEIYLPVVKAFDRDYPPMTIRTTTPCTAHGVRIATIKNLLPWQEF